MTELKQAKPTRYGKSAAAPKKKSTSPRSKSKMPSHLPEINERFKKIREEMGITQQELADAMNVTVSTIKAIENNVVAPNYYVLIKFKHLTGKSYNYILEGKAGRP